jgi:hypothetical protein
MKTQYIVEHIDQNEEREFEWFIGEWKEEYKDREKLVRDWFEEQGFEMEELLNIYYMTKNEVKEIVDSYKTK